MRGGFLGRGMILGILAFAPLLRAAEEIQDFQSRIVVQNNGDLLVTETIRVLAEGREIKRGIYRDFPTLYRGSYGLKKQVPFEVLGVTRDGQREPWHSQKEANGIRIYFGKADKLLDPGVYTYQLRYRTGRQLGFFAEHDELYWNVTGNGWAFPIVRASAEVELPPGVRVSGAEAYTGPEGAKDQNYEVRREGGRAFFSTTKPLSAGEGLTVVVSWPKGAIPPPSSEERVEEAVRSNPGILLGLAGLVVALVYFLVAWVVFGRDPERGVIIPLYAPPRGFSPAAVRYVRGMGKFDHASLAASVLDLAVQGAIRIKGGGSSDYSLEKRSDVPKLTEEADILFQALLGSRQKLVLENSNHEVMKRARKALGEAISKQCDKVYFVRNVPLWIMGLLITLIPLAVSLFDAREIGAAVFMLVWLSFWSMGVAAICMAAVSSWRQAGWKRLGAIPLTVFALPFLAGWVFGLGMLIHSTSVWVAVIYLTGIGMVAVFHHLLKRPTAEGRRIQDEIEGFRRYLSVAEKDRLNLENPPERTPELFEKFLPYALALDVQQRWAEQFSGILQESQYQPDWYSGNQLRNFQAASFATGLAGSLVNSISSSSSAPGSSSGGGGGGSSGGGGGGGGGGGW